jgi:lysophospholipase L1-like esterase
MNMRFLTKRAAVAAACAGWAFFGAGCDGGGGGGRDVGDNDPDVYVCLGDSITRGYGVSGGESYPAQMAGILGKTVYNLGVDGQRSDAGVSRTGSALKRYKPGYMCILYGANDVIHGGSHDAVIGNLRSMVQQCKANKTIPVVGTLPPMVRGHELFNSSVVGLNPKIVQMAKEEGADVADLSGAFGDDESLLQSDGLHPTAEGMKIIATTFAAASK